ncbi:MAG: hypothetical protein FE78DRAFT_66763 [Acidomyces sp. 'richmondensis']|nr:MAG: hypothetical protein FE78DRAFT_66763 [Acidomyces sp. 'richmondensis']
MAQAVKDAPQAPRSQSHGRGGAGNIIAKAGNGAAGIGADDLATPHIKSATYTTGRGGNMATNDPANPSLARAAQDVEAPAYHNKAPKGTFHWGRGGEGNMTTVGIGEGEGEREKTKDRHRSTERRGSKGKERRPSLQGVVEKGREMLGLRKKDGHGEKGKERVEDEGAVIGD